MPSTPRPKILNILAIDDNLDFLASLKDLAASESLYLYTCRSLESAEALLNEHGRESFFHGVILDYLCLKTEDQEIERADFLPEAIAFLNNNLEGVPRVVLSGESGHILGAMDIFPKEKFYDKGDEFHDELFGYLRTEGERLEDLKLISKYRDVFNVFDSGKLDGQIREKLFSLLKGMNKTSSANIQSNLSKVRVLQDAILKSLSVQRPDLITLTGRDFYPKKVFQTLSEAGEIKQNIKDLGMTTYSITSEFGNHEPDPGCFPPTKYTVQALVNHLLDLILWANSEWEG
ncbi:hypothetical protein PQO01_07030 [Lentisphaera marina]|uniref:hypothetical protein n=1 Tax=Lentisphaera marina TaxID=1111041 RepID=UPI0023656E07|nr:hypothetical protein [Lentisphaera marina]MDD7984700.1 hypothetical protein [Lentisphaera marina]